MGMLSAIANAVVVNPVLRGLQAQRTKRDWGPRATPRSTAAPPSSGSSATCSAAAEAPTLAGLVAQRVRTLPDALLDGYLQALEEGLRDSATAGAGFGDFEERFAAATRQP